MTLDLASIAFYPVDQFKNEWLRATLVISGTEHFIDLVAVHLDRHGVQRARTKDLDSKIHLHHLACGADGPFATVTFEGRPFVLFVTPSGT
ncbi:MAG: hypothetical protein ABIQ65_04170 [Thermoanaerobaculia bacterium]